ncbi:MAG: aminoacetone oxidase family FAD-binding enzyme, partial [Planctomycetales bacterium]|nr:aminoacetone oxidase family FAD-binding enzyme [Planctomycetales bacterium]
MPQTSEVWDLIVIGAGAAGMMAVQRAAELGLRALLLEKNRKPGVKILISGGTRCNLTHNTNVAGILEAFGEQAKFLRPAVREFPPERVVEHFHQLGVVTKLEPNGKVFPATDRAYDVQQALWKSLLNSGAEAVLGEAVTQVNREPDSWLVTTAMDRYRARRLLVTTGGCSYSGCGTTGDGYAWMRELGHTIIEPRPALVPLTSPDAWVRELTGVTLEDVVLRAVPANFDIDCTDVNERLARVRKGATITRRTALLFTHFGLSGPAAMDVSRAVTRAEQPSDVQLVCDLLPDETVESLESRLQHECQQQGGRTTGRWLSELIPQRLAVAALERLRLDALGRLAELSRDARRGILRELKSMRLRVDGSRGFAKAEVTAGGVCRDEVNPKTMESR